MIKPLYDMLLVKVEEEDSVSSGGILIVNTNTVKEYSEGVVVEVGNGYKTDDGIKPLHVKQGDRIIYRKGVEVEVDDGDEKYMLVSESTVMAIRT